MVLRARRRGRCRRGRLAARQANELPGQASTTALVALAGAQLGQRDGCARSHCASRGRVPRVRSPASDHRADTRGEPLVRLPAAPAAPVGHSCGNAQTSQPEAGPSPPSPAGQPAPAAVPTTAGTRAKGSLTSGTAEQRTAQPTLACADAGYRAVLLPHKAWDDKPITIEDGDKAGNPQRRKALNLSETPTKPALHWS